MGRFSSLGFANLLLLLIALSAAFGTLPFRFERFPLNPPEIFQSKGFLSLLGLLAFSTTASLIRKIALLSSRGWKGSGREIPPSFSEKLATESAVPFSAVVRKRKEVLSTLRKHGYQATHGDESGRDCYRASRDRWGSWGSPLLHFGLVVVLIGGLLTFLFSDIRDISLPEGETVSLPGSGTKVRLEKFSLLFYPGTTQPENYVSRLRVREKKGKIRNHDLKVNFPVKLGDVKLFQMRYKVEILKISLLVYHHGKPLERIDLRPGERKALGRLPFSIAIDQVVPDFAIDPNGNVSSRSPYFRNPAAWVLLSPLEDPEAATEKKWAFQGLAFHSKGSDSEWGFVIEKIRKRYHSGIKVSRDPGVPWAYGGFIFLVLGAFISSFVIPRNFELRLSVPARGEGTLMEWIYPKTKDAWGARKELLRLQSELVKKISEREP